MGLPRFFKRKEWPVREYTPQTGNEFSRVCSSLAAEHNDYYALSADATFQHRHSPVDIDAAEIPTMGRAHVHVIAEKNERSYITVMTATHMLMQIGYEMARSSAQTTEGMEIIYSFVVPVRERKDLEKLLDNIKNVR